MPIGVWYDAGDRTPATVLRDLQTIRALGFNHVKAAVRWVSAEPERGMFRFEALERLLTLADRADFKVIVEPDLTASPAWLDGRSSDSRMAGAFVEAVAARAAAHRSVHALNPPLTLFSAAMEPRPAGVWSASAVNLAWRLDALRSAARDRGWIVGALRVRPDVTGADLRLWGWSALARGARAISYASWYPSRTSAGSGLVEPDGEITERARAPGELAGMVSRNAALFAPLRPRPSRVAVVYNPLWDVVPLAPAVIAHGAMLEFYGRMFARNTQTDIIFPHEVAAGAASQYAVVYAAAPEMLPRAVGAALEAYRQAGGKVVTDVAATQVEPDIRLDGGGGLIEARFLESADAIVLIGLNYGDSARTVTFTFAPDTPEAIWQNMETGASVSFVQGRDGLTYAHTFAPRDALVLMIRKRLR